MCPLRAQLLGRARFAEEQLEKAIKTGIHQYALLGAGLDSFALRRKDLTSTLKVYELDHPASQTAKRSLLAKLNMDLPTNLEFVAIDFERESVPDALARSSYSNGRPVFFSWLGVTPYLTHEAIFNTLRSIATSAKPGSEIVFDYSIPRELIDPADMPIRDWVERSVARQGEPQITAFDPTTLEQAVDDLGFELIEHLSPMEQKERYFAGRKDGLRPALWSYLAHLRSRM
jgi:methyltransferase (TIGR00027 family)